MVRAQSLSSIKIVFCKIYATPTPLAMKKGIDPTALTGRADSEAPGRKGGGCLDDFLDIWDKNCTKKS
jgi:hypothetical protein